MIVVVNPYNFFFVFYYHGLTDNNYGVDLILLNNMTIILFNRLLDGYCKM